MKLKIPSYPEIYILYYVKEDRTGGIKSNISRILCKKDTPSFSASEEEIAKYTLELKKCRDIAGTIETLIISHACAGVDVSSKEYCEEIAKTIDAWIRWLAIY